MNVDILKKQIMSYAARLKEQRLSSEPGDLFAAKTGDGYFICTPVDKAPDEVTADDFLTLPIDGAEGKYALIAEIFKAREDVGAVLIDGANYSAAAAAVTKKFRPALDDMAQIVGPGVRRASMDAKSIIKAMKGRNACITPEGSITAGRTPDEAFTTALVLEKGARIYVLAKRVGGAKFIGRFDAVLMHLVYRKKYSKVDQTAKMEEVKE